LHARRTTHNAVTIVKICGLRTLGHALAAVEAGADWLGLVFAPSRRQVTPDQAVGIVAGLRSRVDGQRAQLVGLFVNTGPDEINTIVAGCGLDYAQLSGDETPEQAAGIACPIVKSIRLDGTAAEVAWLTLVQDKETRRQRDPEIGRQRISRPPCLPVSLSIRFAPAPLLVDAHVAGAYGGTGTLANWRGAAELARRLPLLLAGGLTPENVAAAIEQVRPWGVDVSSGVEINGTKDVGRIDAFVRAVRAAG
jgi:phosphoribosylanthranilate isomerase